MLNYRLLFRATTFLFFVLNILNWSMGIPSIYYFSLFACFFGFVFWGTSRIHSQFLLPSICFCPAPHQVCLSFDDGPHPVYTPKILDLLAENQIKAYFFVVGKNVYQFPEIIQRIQQEGHIIGNHSFSHSHWFDFFSARRMQEEILMTDRLIEKQTQLPSVFFRPPYGVTTLSMRKAFRKLPHEIIGWSNRSFDTISKNENKVFLKIIQGLKRKQNIILLHDTQALSVEVLRKLIPYIQEKGLEVTVTINKQIS